MPLEFNYHTKLPHNQNWVSGYELGMSCQDYYNKWFKLRPSGPKNGEKIILRNLPSKAYVRFWAARPRKNGQPWDSVKTAYNEEKGESEMEPPVNYFNGGMVPVDCHSKAVFRLFLPVGYMSEKGYISPHFHYRVCRDGKMGPVHTEYINDDGCSDKSCPLLVMRDYNNINNNLNHYSERLFPMRKNFKKGKKKLVANSIPVINTCQSALQEGCVDTKIYGGPVSGVVMGPDYINQPVYT